jgi:hypothetical protein
LVPIPAAAAAEELLPAGGVEELLLQAATPSTAVAARPIRTLPFIVL